MIGRIAIGWNHWRCARRAWLAAEGGGGAGANAALSTLSTTAPSLGSDDGSDPSLQTLRPQRRVHIVTHGCQMNVSDSDLVRRILHDAGWDPFFGAGDAPPASPPEETADVLLINTCAIREGAEARVFGRLAKIREVKRRRRLEGR